MIRKTIVLSLAIGLSNCYAQIGKNAAFNTVTSAFTVINAYTNLASDATAGNSSITVTDNSLIGGSVFSSALEPGDLLFIIQMKGASLNAFPVDIGGGDTLGFPNDVTLGSINNYNNCGNYEFAEVIGTTGSTIINLRCNLQFSYTSADVVQVIRVPRFDDLTVNAAADITTPAWNGSTGGAVILEVAGNLILNGSIDTDALGFRGGTTDNTTTTFAGQHAGTDPSEGARKGEGIGGYDGSYSQYGGMYGKGAFANAGGGGTAHNSGGGGGANAASIAWLDGLGNPDVSGGAGWVSAWNLEGTSVPNAMTSTTTSGGGGRGGYTWSDVNQDATTVGPGNGAWAGDSRRVQGGLGGRPLDYSTGKLFFGGGGGAGEMNDNEGGAGGNAGGLVFARVFGSISGSGTVSADGEDGGDSDGPTPFSGTSGSDGSGGGGAGGTIVLMADGSISGINVNANGGNGGNQLLEVALFSSPEAQGPGGGGGGGYIATTASTATISFAGGSNGTTNSSDLSEFTPNGATAGSSGDSNTGLSTFGLTVVSDTICGGGIANLSVSTYGTTPPGSSILWYSDTGQTIINSGSTYTTGVLIADTTFYVGICDGGVLIPVNVLVSPPIVINATAQTISDETCAGNDGSITGLVVTGGSAPISYDWNGSASSTPDTTGVSGGSYTLTVTDANGCSETHGPVTVNTAPGPTIDTTAVVVTNENCGGADGSITGIVATGTGLSIFWNGIPVTSEDTLNLGAGSYTISVTDANGCTVSEGPFTVLNIGAPLIDTSGIVITDETCSSSNGSITGITASGGVAPLVYNWNGNNTVSADTIGIASGSYTLTVTDAANCSATVGPLIVSDLSAPTIDTSSIVIVGEHCDLIDGSITGIVVSGNAPFVFDWNGNATLTADTVGLADGSYTLTVQDINGCISTMGPVIVDSIEGPTIDDTGISIALDTCQNGVGGITGISVTGSGGYIFSWNGGVTSTTDTLGLNSGSYSFNVTDSNGCAASSGPYNVASSIPPSIDTSLMIVSDENCGNSDGSITNINVSGGGLTYFWNGAAVSTPDLNGIGAGSYNLVVADSLGCTDSVGPVIVNGTPPITINVTGTNTICEGQSTTLTATGATNYTWIPSGSGSPITVTPLVTTTYQLIGNTGPCFDTTSYTITVNPLPTASVTGFTSICEGSSAVLMATGGTSFIWTTGDVTNTISVTPANTTSYGVVVSNACGNDSTGITVVVNPLPAANAGPDQTIILGNSANLSGSGGSAYIWSPSGGLSCSSCQNPIATPLTTTTYVLQVTDVNGCTKSDTVTVFVEEVLTIYIPNIFSPNGDGNNDVFMIRGGGIADAQLRVFDRWGELIFMSDNISLGWDGTYQGRPAIVGVYAYVVTGMYLDGTSIKQTGNVTLVR